MAETKADVLRRKALRRSRFLGNLIMFLVVLLPENGGNILDDHLIAGEQVGVNA